MVFWGHHILLMTRINKVRYYLTLLGVFIAVFIFSCGNIITNSYYNNSLNVINEMKEHTIILESNKVDLEEKINLSKDIFTLLNEVCWLSEKSSIYSAEINNGRGLTVMADVNGVSNSSIIPIVTDEGIVFPKESELIKGRNINSRDLLDKTKVVVIDELTEQILFPNSDGIGKFIQLDVGINGSTVGSDDKEEDKEDKYFEIIGVIKNSNLQNNRKILMQGNIERTKENVYVYTSIYIPLTSFNTIYFDKEKNEYCFYKVKNDNSYDYSLKELELLEEYYEKRNTTISILSKEELVHDLELQLSDTKIMLNGFTIVLCIISGISIMGITFFSIKERIPEIGIRKAFGASKIDVATQFFGEMFIIGLEASILAVCISYYGCKMLEGYLTSSLFICFYVSISNELLFMPMVVGVLQTIISSSIPCIYASQINVVDSLRFE